MVTGRRIETQAHSQTCCEPLTENALLERCQAGDPDAWNTLFHRYSGIVYNAAYGRCRNRDDANDIVGLVFLHLYQHLHTYRQQVSFRIWLFILVRNTFIDHCIRPAHKKNVSLDAAINCENESFEGSNLVDPTPSPEALCMRREVAKLLAGAVRSLPCNHRTVLDMHYTEDKTYEEIAAATGVSLGTVKSRMHRARTMLRERMTSEQDAVLVA